MTSEITSGNNSMIPLLISVIMGTGLLIAGITIITKALKLKIIEKIGLDSVGYFIYTESNYTENNVKKYYILFAFKNEQGEEFRVKTPSTYSRSEAEYYAFKRKFKIKYKGKKAVIVEKIDLETLDKLYEKLANMNLENLNPNDFVELNINDNDNNSSYYLCPYCGVSQNKIGKCTNCGAKITDKDARKDYFN
ncbi:MAG: hypothetical protein IJD48_01010 [Clostridia bacterium]|nr:hypothetical protein [Clostridia bacterium]